MTSVHFRGEHGKHGALHKGTSRYIHQRMIQITQTAACNRFHPVEARLARWLLMTRDRMGTNHFHHTQELLGNMLGVLRVAVTNAAGALQQRKLISYSRGQINILAVRVWKQRPGVLQIFKDRPREPRPALTRNGRTVARDPTRDCDADFPQMASTDSW